MSINKRLQGMSCARLLQHTKQTMVTNLLLPLQEQKATMPNAALDWTRLYYDGVEHLLWNRDWISGTQPDGTRTPIRLLMERLRRLEAPLHHTLQLFFTLAPLSLTARLLKLDIKDLSSFHIASCADWERVMIGAKAENALELCIPDIFIEGPGTQIAIEIKAKGKSSLEQVIKYAALMLIRSQSNPLSSKRLIFVAPYSSFTEFWQRKAAYPDVDAMKADLLTFSNDKVERQLLRFGTSLQKVKESLGEVEISWRSIADIRDGIKYEIAEGAGRAPSPAEEVYSNLLIGLEKELQRWQPSPQP